METNSAYSSELNNVLTYMVGVLGKEFPAKEYSPEYLVLSMMDNNKCHAKMLLDCCIISDNIQQLKNIYIEHLNKSSRRPFLFRKTSNDVVFNDELITILENAKKELEKTSNSKLVGSEHVLLSMLSNETNNEKIINVFKAVGVDYNFLLSRCVETQKNELKISEKKKMNNNDIVNIIKSQINPKAVVGKTDYISSYTTNINKLISENKIDKLIGRDKEVEMVIRVLARRKKNNAVLVGNGGCGKTSIVYGIAERIVNDKVPSILRNKEIVQLNIMALISGTHFRGMMEERVNGLFDELKSNKNYILFIDDMQQIMKTGSKEKDTDLSPMLSEILAGGDVCVIGTTSFKDYRNGIEANTSLARRMQKIVIEPNTVDETIKILEENKKYYEKYHHVLFNNDVIKKTVELSERYITDRSLPDSAIDVLDLTGAYTCFVDKEPTSVSNSRKRLIEIDKERQELLNHGDFEKVDSLAIEENEAKATIAEYERELDSNEEKYSTNITIDDIAKSISDMTNIPISKLSTNEKEKIATIDTVLKKSVVGQDDAIDGICRIIKRNKIGLGDKKRVLGAVMMIGPSGVGKTLIAKKLAEEIFGSEKDLIRIDMSEYSEKNSVAKLTGAAPGYIGYENGGQLTEAIKNKQHCVLLLDEIEKADQEVYNLFLQLFDEGRLTDSAGQVVNFKNVIVLMTSNIGAKQASEFGKGSGFITDEGSNKKSIIEKQLKKKFSPEFINRIDQIVYFNPLTDESLKSIVELEMKKLQTRIIEIGYDIIWDESLVNHIHSLCLASKEYGARPIIRLIQDNVEDKITDLLLLNDYENNHIFNLSYENSSIVVK